MDNMIGASLSLDDLEINELEVSQFLDATIEESSAEISKVMSASCTTCECCCSCSILVADVQ
jgi:thiazolylpeptide-type bacteriocin precursor